MTQNEFDIKVTETLAQELQKGVPILMKDGFLEPESLEEGSILKIQNAAGQFIGKGYVGKQNKGLGWILTKNENEKIDQSFFQKNSYGD